jgi:hypothetical protein
LDSQEDATIKIAESELPAIVKVLTQDLVNEVPAQAKQHVNQGRRRSERLKETTSLHTMEKVDKLVKKRNLEGNSSTANKFSALLIEEIAHTIADMGISIKHDDFATFDLLKTLEMARGIFI